MKILITGAGGLVGGALVPALMGAGHTITRLSHAAPWPDLAGHAAVIHLAGENIAGGRWTPVRKARIRDSRVVLTQRLAAAVAALPEPPAVFLCASATGFYGDRGAESLREDSPAGTGFLAEVCQAWEAATAIAAQRGLRVVRLRFGPVLSAQGGALARMLTPFKLGCGGVIGDGRQWWSWVAVDDAVQAIQHALATAALSGAVNVVAPGAVTNREFTRRLAQALRRPALCPLPAWAARWALGEMADELLLSSQRVVPAKLLESGFVFQYPELACALPHLLAASGARSGSAAG